MRATRTGRRLRHGFRSFSPGGPCPLLLLCVAAVAGEGHSATAGGLWHHRAPAADSFPHLQPSFSHLQSSPDTETSGFLSGSATLHFHPNTEGFVTATVFSPPVLMTSANASLLHDVTRSWTLDPRNILRLRIHVGPGWNIRSPPFLQMLKMALENLYLAALKRRRRSKSGWRHKRQVGAPVTAQVVGVGSRSSAGQGREEEEEVAVEFTLTRDGHQVTVGEALSTLSDLTAKELQELIHFPVVKLEGSLNSTLAVGDPTATDMTVFTSGILVLATKISSTSTSSSASSTSSSSSLSSSSSSYSSASSGISSASSLTITPPLTSSAAFTATATTVSLPPSRSPGIGSSVPHASSSSFTTTPMPSTVSPTPSTSAVTPSSSQTPLPPTDRLREALLSLDLDLRHVEEEQESVFRNNFEKGIVRAYHKALQARRKRHAPVYDDVINRRHERYLRQTGPEVDAQVTHMQKNADDPQLTNVTFYVIEDGQPVTALISAPILNRLTDTALSALLAYPVVSPVHPVDRPLVTPSPPIGGDDIDRRLFVVVIVLPSVLLLLLTISLLATLFHSCRHPLEPRYQGARAVVTTKYQRGDSLSDYSQNLDMERADSLELTPVHSRVPTPDIFPPSRDRHSKASSADSAADDARRRDVREEGDHRWLRPDQHYRERSVGSVDSARHYHHHHHQNHHGNHHQDSRRNDSLYESSFFRVRADPSHYQPREERPGEILVTGEREGGGEDEEEAEVAKRSVVYTQRKPPQARPRSFLRKLQHSRKGHNRYSPNQQEPTTAMTTFGGDATHTAATDRPRSRDTKGGREPKSRDANSSPPTADASDEFMIVVSRPGSAYSSRERLASYTSAHTDGSDGEGQRKRTSSLQEPQTNAPPGKSEPSVEKQDSSNKGISDRPPDAAHSGRRSSEYFQSASEHRGDDQTAVTTTGRGDGEGQGEGVPEQSTPGDPSTSPYLCTATQKTQTSLSSYSDVSEGGERRGVTRVKNVAVGPDNVSKKTQTPSDYPEDLRKQGKRKSRKQDSFSSKQSSDGHANSKELQFLLLRQQQQQQQQWRQREVMELVHRHLAESRRPPPPPPPPSSHLLPPSSSSSTGKPSTSLTATDATHHPPPLLPTSTSATPEGNRQILKQLLNEACVLAGPSPPRGHHYDYPVMRGLAQPGVATFAGVASHPAVQNGHGEDVSLSVLSARRGASPPSPQLPPPPPHLLQGGYLLSQGGTFGSRTAAASGARPHTSPPPPPPPPMSLSPPGAPEGFLD